jgi:hypothetical protein
VSGQRRARAWGKQRQNIDPRRFLEALMVIAADLDKAPDQGEQGSKKGQKEGE